MLFRSSYVPNYYDQLLALQEEMNAKKRQQAIAQIENSYLTAKNGYDKQLGQLADYYDPLKNQSEVQRYQEQRRLREALANRGALDTGAGRQENLALQTNYGNRLNQINLAEQNERKTIQEAMAQLEAQKANAIANAGLEFDINSLNNNLNMLQKQQSSQASSARNSASNLVSNEKSMYSNLASNFLDNIELNDKKKTTNNKYLEELLARMTLGTNT